MLKIEGLNVKVNKAKSIAILVLGVFLLAGMNPGKLLADVTSIAPPSNPGASQPQPTQPAPQGSTAASPSVPTANPAVPAASTGQNQVIDASGVPTAGTLSTASTSQTSPNASTPTDSKTVFTSAPAGPEPPRTVRIPILDRNTDLNVIAVDQANRPTSVQWDSFLQGDPWYSNTAELTYDGVGRISSIRETARNVRTGEITISDITLEYWGQTNILKQRTETVSVASSRSGGLTLYSRRRYTYDIAGEDSTSLRIDYDKSGQRSFLHYEDYDNGGWIEVYYQPDGSSQINPNSRKIYLSDVPIPAGW